MVKQRIFKFRTWNKKLKHFIPTNELDKKDAFDFSGRLIDWYFQGEITGNISKSSELLSDK